LSTWIKPQLAALVKAAPDGPDWLREIKLDGCRMHARLDAGRVKIITRRGNDWTDKYPALAEAIAALPAQSVYLDGELCGVLPDGRTAFNLIQNATDTGDASLVCFAFDLLHLDGEDITGLHRSTARPGWRRSWSARRKCSATTITRSAKGRHSINWPASMAWKALSRSRRWSVRA
jgi:ATP-dependent DNA ligase